MRIRAVAAGTLAVFLLAATRPVAAADPPDVPSLAHEVLTILEEHFFDPERLPAAREAMQQAVAAYADQSEEEAGRRIVDAMLEALDVSHTRRYTSDEPAFYELLDIYRNAFPERLRAMFDGGQVSYTGIEIRTAREAGGHFVREILAGGPADQAGLRVGDEILAVDGKPLEPVASFVNAAGREVVLSIRREAGAAPIERTVTPRRIQPREAYERAMRDSARIIERDDLKIGYIRIYSYAGPRFHSRLVFELTSGALSAADALILDLRGGWGGASPEYARYFTGITPEMKMINREGLELLVSQRSEVPERRGWNRPLIVLVDAFSRSGKEVLAKAFRDAGVPLVGVTTSGAVLGARPFLLEDDSLLVVATFDVIVDGERLEGTGVAPTHEVPFEFRYAAGGDPQLEEAIRILVSR